MKPKEIGQAIAELIAMQMQIAAPLITGSDGKVCYIVLNPKTASVKIGSSSDPLKRLKQLQTGSSEKLHLLGFWAFVTGGATLEAELHSVLSRHRIGSSEWFEISDGFWRQLYGYTKIPGLNIRWVGEVDPDFMAALHIKRCNANKEHS